MTFFAILLLLLAVVGLFAYVVPFLIGLVIIGIGNGISKSSRGKIAPVWWNILTVAVTIFSAVMFYKDVFSESIDTGPQPFIILIVYGLISFALIGVLSATRKDKGVRINTKSTKNQSATHWSDDLHKGLKKSNSTTAKKEYDWKLKETWEDYPMPDYDAVHTYCSVAFDDSGKTFYYRTRNPELRVGDFVYVPVGYKYQKRMGRIVDMQDYLGSEAPYPLEKTKFISEKVDNNF